MNSHKIVCPFNGNVLARFSGQAVVVNTNDMYEINHIYNECSRFQNILHCVRVYTDIPLDCIEFKDEWQGIPFALYAPTLGRFTQFVTRLPVLRQLNVRVYLPIDTTQNITWLRVLSSLGIATAVNFDGGMADWDALCDLATYALLGRSPHAAIEPFNYIANHFAPTQMTSWEAVYFNDPTKYLHVDDNGCVALTDYDLQRADFVANNIGEVGDITQNTRYNERIQSWRGHFLKPEGCAYCGGWRVCQGRFSGSSADNGGCGRFFVDLMDIIQQYQNLKGKRKELWQL